MAREGRYVAAAKQAGGNSAAEPSVCGSSPARPPWRPQGGEELLNLLLHEPRVAQRAADFLLEQLAVAFPQAVDGHLDGALAQAQSRPGRLVRGIRLFAGEKTLELVEER